MQTCYYSSLVSYSFNHINYMLIRLIPVLIAGLILFAILGAIAQAERIACATWFHNLDIIVGNTVLSFFSRLWNICLKWFFKGDARPTSNICTIWLVFAGSMITSTFALSRNHKVIGHPLKECPSKN